MGENEKFFLKFLNRFGGGKDEEFRNEEQLTDPVIEELIAEVKEQSDQMGENISPEDIREVIEESVSKEETSKKSAILNRVFGCNNWGEVLKKRGIPLAREVGLLVIFTGLGSLKGVEKIPATVREVVIPLLGRIIHEKSKPLQKMTAEELDRIFNNKK